VDSGIKKAMTLSPTFPSNLTSKNRESMRKMILGWFRFKDHQILKEESYILDLASTLDFIFSNSLVNTREFLVSSLKDYQFTDAQIKDFKIDNVSERVLAVKILEFPEILERVLLEKNLSLVTRYFEMLSVMTREFVEKKQGNLILVKASLTVLGKCLFILGVI